MTSFPGAAALRAYYVYLGASSAEALVMLENPDAPSRVLPGGAAPCVLTDALAAFERTVLGPGWGPTRHHAGDEAEAEDGPDPEPVPVIALTGRRRTGKSSLTDRLCERTGYEHAHPFNAGKALIRGWLRSRGASASEADRMVDGDLKDSPCGAFPRGPDGSRRSPRYLMEELGAFMPAALGPEWTLGVEIRRVTRRGASGIVLSSAAHEAGEIAAMPRSLIIRIVSDEEARSARAGGVNLTDLACDGVAADLTFRNDMDGPAVLDRWDAFLEEAGIVRPESEDDLCP